MVINFSENLITKKPFIGVAFLFSILLSVISGLAQSSDDYLKTTNTEKGKLHFIKPLEFNSVSPGNSFVLDIAITQNGNSIDSAIVNFTFTTRKHAPKIDSVQINSKAQTLRLNSIENYYVEKKGSRWVSRNGFDLNKNDLLMLLQSPEAEIFVYAHEEKTPLKFGASSQWEKMVGIVPQILF